VEWSRRVSFLPPGFARDVKPVSLSSGHTARCPSVPRYQRLPGKGNCSDVMQHGTPLMVHLSVCLSGNKQRSIWALEIAVVHHLTCFGFPTNLFWLRRREGCGRAGHGSAPIKLACATRVHGTLGSEQARLGSTCLHCITDRSAAFCPRGTVVRRRSMMFLRRPLFVCTRQLCVLPRVKLIKLSDTYWCSCVNL